MVRLTCKASVLVGHHGSTRCAWPCWILPLSTQICPVRACAEEIPQAQRPEQLKHYKVTVPAIENS